jgi:hypothetical protein
MRHLISVPFVAALLALPLSAAAVNLTGTWEGKMVCKGQDLDGSKAKFTIGPPDVLSIQVTQTGNALAMHIVFSDATDVYSGLVAEDAKKTDKGRLFLAHCTTNDVQGDENDMGNWDETADLAVSSNDKGKGKIKGLSTYLDNLGEGSCKWSLKRMGTADPGVAGCGG